MWGSAIVAYCVALPFIGALWALGVGGVVLGAFVVLDKALLHL
jgi:hypothetical protein